MPTCLKLSLCVVASCLAESACAAFVVPVYVALTRACPTARDATRARTVPTASVLLVRLVEARCVARL